MRTLLAILTLLLAAPAADASWRFWEHFQSRQSCTAPGIPNTFDEHIYWAAKRYMSEPLRSKPCLLKAICWTESRLKPDAKSHVGAIGLCQVMQGTFVDAHRKHPTIGRNLRNVRTNIAAGAIELDRAWRVWIAPRSNACRWDLAAASYNAGAGHVIKAQTLSGGARCWETIRHFLDDVTGKHAVETVDYVDRVNRAYWRLLGFRW